MAKNTDIMNRILKIMDEQSITAYRLSKDLELNVNTVANWKSQKSNPPAHLIAPIASYLGVSPMYLLTGQEDSTPSTGTVISNALTDEREALLLSMYRQLDYEGKTLVLAAAIREQRRQSEMITSQKTNPA